MQNLYPFMISFVLIFFSELGDKTQVLVLSFSAKNKAIHIILGIALGTLLSHGIAIAFGCQIAAINNDSFTYFLKFLTYFTFLIFGIVGFITAKKSASVKQSTETDSKFRITRFLTSFFKNVVFMVAISIAIGELGDKTFLASLGLGIQYPHFKIPLICGSVCGMIASNSIAIFLGKWLGSKISSSTIENLSNTIFILFGILGLLMLKR